ncbi:P2 family phage contractile tail tube protein [Sporomusaceae bacterium BoRhaA]|uniref:phage major tail tube protein n=1 Tax=Pelorhabdus rhamnosifermentans TaxID=2772457 RepID=UPI001C06201B|nr:phage major tail tube protein [Pelorhabdus rhamnosifermentans]MBU2701687.1 P2 family phage contractile tail tube protein [Pelorhabdus rhamnosifermentans]
MGNVNIMPERITGYRVYKDSVDLLGVVDVELPKIQLISDTIKGAGILGEIETPTVGQTKPMKVKINFRTTNKPMLNLLECVGHNLEFREAVQKYDLAGGGRSYDKNRIIVRGFPSEGELEKLESNGANSSSIELNCIYLKYVINDETVLEIDKINYKYIVNGNDSLSIVRDALGLI